MNRWKIAFFTLAGLVITVVIALILAVSGTTSSPPLPKHEPNGKEVYALALNTTKENFEGIANTYIQKAMKGKPLPIELAMEDDVVLTSELTIFSYTLPFEMHFDPIVQEDGNLILKQSSMELGDLNIPPSTVLKLLKSSVELPDWMIVRPKEEEIFIDLRDLPVSGDIQVKAKTVNLASNEIQLEVLVPKQ